MLAVRNNLFFMINIKYMNIVSAAGQQAGFQCWKSVSIALASSIDEAPKQLLILSIYKIFNYPYL